MRRLAAKERRLYVGCSLLLVLIGISGILLAAGPHAGTAFNASQRSAAITAKASAIPQSAQVAATSAISQIPNSFAIVKDPPYAASSPSIAGNGSGGTVTAGDSKANCITLDFPYGVLNQSTITAATSLTGITYNCLETFANPAPTWADWETPWMFSTTSDGWDAWLAASPAHQVIMGIDLIPQTVSDNDDPLTWEQACAAGSYDQYATTLAKNLVSYGAGGVVIRLGIEANGPWEADYTGSTTTEMNDWAKCYDNEVTAMRAVSGTHFLFVWDPNVCTQDFALDEWYPGNSYVDIIGADAYDTDCSTKKTVSEEGWKAYSTNNSANTPNDPNFPSIANIEAFAVANGKPMSFPEWGLRADIPDDATYMTDMGQMFNTDDFSFESYFNTDDDEVVPLGSSIPSATAAYSRAFHP